MASSVTREPPLRGRGIGGGGGGGGGGADEDPLAGVFAAVAGRMSWCLAELAAERGPPAGAKSAREAMAAYTAASHESPHLEPGARAMMAPLVDHICADVALAKATSQWDPAAPWLEGACWAHLDEMSDLAAVFVTGRRGGECPDPTDEHAADYCRVRAAIADLVEVTGNLGPLWRLQRASWASARGRPPPRPAPGGPLADDREYHI